MKIDDKTSHNSPSLRFPEFTGEWEESTIGKEFDLYSGNTPSRLNKEHFKGKVNWISSGEWKNHYIYSSKEQISEDAAKNLKLLPKGTFVIAIYGLEAEGVRGTGSITQEPSTISQACMAFIPQGDIENEFLYSWYKKHGEVIGVRYAQGTKQQNLSYDILEKFKIAYPSIKEQKKLNKFIALLDERIAVQNRLIEDLKKLRCAIVEKMFKQSKANGRLGDFIEQVSVRNKNGLYSNVLSVSNKQGFVKQSEQFEDRTVASEDTSNYKIVKRNNFAYNPARINVGSIARLTKFDVGIVSPMYVCFRTKASIIPEYMEAFFTSQLFFYEMMKRLEGSVRLCLSYEGLCNIPVYIPDMNKQIAMGQNISLILSKIGLEIEYLGRLHQQKQYLLRKMFIWTSDEVDIAFPYA